MVGHRHGFCEALRFIINTTGADGVDIAPIIFALWMDQWIAVALAGGGDEKGRFLGFGKPKGVMRSERSYLQCLDGKLKDNQSGWLARPCGTLDGHHLAH